MANSLSRLSSAQVRTRRPQKGPAVADAPAVDLTPDQVLDMLRRLIEAGKGRTANKLRSYIRAAYQCALDVRTIASIPVVFTGIRRRDQPRRADASFAAVRSRRQATVLQGRAAGVLEADR